VAAGFPTSSTVSMLRTIELLVWIGPMTYFDGSADPMFSSFTDPRTSPRPT
jgi:hypothetical protein